MARPLLRAIALALAVALHAGAAAAQAQMDALRNSAPEDRAAAQTEFMKAKLALTPEQLPKIEALNLEYAKKLDPVLKSSDGPRVKTRTIRTVETEKEAALQKILTPEQFQTFLASKDALRQHLLERLAAKRGAAPN